MKRKVVVVAVPSLGQVSIQWAFAFSDLSWPMNYRIVKLAVVGRPVAEARNELVVKALALEDDRTEVSHVFWVDDDVLPARGALVQLMLRRTPIIAGVYFSKGDPSEPLMFPAPLAGTAPMIPNQVMKMWGHGQGLTLVESGVYRRMLAELELGRDQQGNPQWYRTLDHEDVALGDGTSENWTATEDLYFLSLAAKLGFEPMVDTGEACFGWHFDKDAQKGYPAREWKEKQDTGQVTWPTPAGPVVWKE